RLPENSLSNHLPSLGLDVPRPSCPPLGLPRSAIGLGAAGVRPHIRRDSAMLGRSGREGSRLPATRLARFRSRHFWRRHLSVARFRKAGDRRASSLGLGWDLGAAAPLFASGLQGPDGAREGYVAAGRRPQGARGSSARSLAARPPLPLPADSCAAGTPPGEHGLRGQAVRVQRFRFSGQPGLGTQGPELEVRVPQIGAGVSLPGIVAAKCGAEVTLSDSSELPHCLATCRHSCQINNLPQVNVVGITWGHVSQELLALPPQDIILASDVFFEPEDFEDILTTIYFLMQKNPKVQLWSTYQVRSADWSLEALLYKWDMKCVHIPLGSFDADKEDLAESALPGRHTVEMLVISSAKDIHKGYRQHLQICLCNPGQRAKVKKGLKQCTNSHQHRSATHILCSPRASPPRGGRPRVTRRLAPRHPCAGWAERPGRAATLPFAQEDTAPSSSGDLGGLLDRERDLDSLLDTGGGLRERDLERERERDLDTDEDLDLDRRADLDLDVERDLERVRERDLERL
ncbi:Methyltransferase-like protein 23, partial [Galemys pyrenaicus]